MSNCYVCGCELTPENRSVEHILPNAIGGRLKSSDLLCREHNSTLGEGIDAALAKQLTFFSTMLSISRDRGETPSSVRVTRSDTGEEVDLQPDGHVTLARPRHQRSEVDGVVHILHTSRDTQEAEEMLLRMRRRYPHIDVGEIIASAEPICESVSQLRFGIDITCPLVLRSICKTAVSYFIYSGGDPACVSHLVEYIRVGSESSPVALYYPAQDIVQKGENEILHTVALVGDSSQRILYAYVELFSCVQYLVTLNLDYHGDIRARYCYDVLAGGEVGTELSLHLSRSDVEAGSRDQDNILDKIQAGFSRACRVACIKQERERRGKAIGEVVDRVFSSHSNEAFLTPAMVGEIADGVANTVLPGLVARSRCDE